MFILRGKVCQASEGEGHGSSQQVARRGGGVGREREAQVGRARGEQS